MAGGKKQSKSSKDVEDALLQDFSRDVSTKSSALFYGNAFIVSAIPIWLFWRVHQMDLYLSAVWFVLMTGVSTWLVAYAYKNVKFVLKHKIAQKREDAISKFVIKSLGDAKKLPKDKDERILWKKIEVAEYEATTFSIFYNNALYLTLLIVTSFYILRGLNTNINYVLSTFLAGGALALFSTATK